MLSLARRRVTSTAPVVQSTLARALATSTKPFASTEEVVSPIAQDGRHEIWREGQSSDHDNEPR